jgi:electron transfer flavoprotein-quinone oxidoreductase
MDKIDVVIVGAGLSGLSCAYRLADSGLQVIVVERGDAPGSKNVTGGRLYLKPIEGMVGDMLEGAPFERRVVRERWTLLGRGRSLTADLTSERFRNEQHSATLLRATFDQWLAERVMEKGVFVIPKYRVDGLLWEGNSVAGIKAGSEEIWSHAVVASDGVLSFMAQKAGLRAPMEAPHYAVGVKEVIELPEGTISDRFNVENGEGCAHLFLGDVTKGLFGGGFIYTNRSSLSIGVVAGTKALMEGQGAIEVHGLIDSFKERYEVKNLIAGGTLAEYSAHLIPEAGHAGLAKLCGNGIVVTGDAAGFALNMGVTVRGMEFAIASGIMAADAIIEAREKADFSEAGLAGYERRLKDSFVLKDMANARELPAFLDNDDWFNLYPNSLPEILERIMWFGEGPREKLGASLWKGLKASGLMNWKGLSNLFKLMRI